MTFRANGLILFYCSGSRIIALVRCVSWRDELRPLLRVNPQTQGGEIRWFNSRHTFFISAKKLGWLDSSICGRRSILICGPRARASLGPARAWGRERLLWQDGPRGSWSSARNTSHHRLDIINTTTHIYQWITPSNYNCDDLIELAWRWAGLGPFSQPIIVPLLLQ